MSENRSIAIFKRMDEFELSLCLFCNRFGRWQTVERLFVVVSRLGNGVFWYTLVTLLVVVDGVRGSYAALHMIVVGLLGVIIYKLLKTRMVRQRPYLSWEQIRNGTAPLDLYSFPSGHTLHAVCFTTIACYYYPGLAWLLVPFAVLVALSRVVLGLHYPTDVLVGAILGGVLALVSFDYWPWL